MDLNEEEDFWEFKSNRENSPKFDAKSKKDEFNINNRKEEVNNNKREEIKQQPHDHSDADDRRNEGTEDGSVRIEKLIKSLDKLKPTQHDRDEFPEGQKSVAYPVNDDRHTDISANENHTKSSGNDHLQNGNPDVTTDSDVSGSERESHGTTTKEKKRKADLKLDSTDQDADGFGHAKGDGEVIPAQDPRRTQSRNDAESLDGVGDETFIDYGLLDEGSQLKRSSHVATNGSFMANEDSEEKTFEAHPPRSGAPRRSRRKTRKPNAVANPPKRSNHSGQDLDHQRPVRDTDEQGPSCDENLSPKLSPEADSSGKENLSTPRATQKRRSRNRGVKATRSISPEGLGKDRTGGETEGSRSPRRMRKELRSSDYDWSLSGNEEVRDWVKRKNRIARKQKAEDRRKERIKKQEADGKMVGLAGDQEKKNVESLERRKKPKPKQRARSCPGEGRVSDGEVLPRSKSQPRMSKELRSGDFDWSTSKNEEIRVWLKKKKRLIREKRAEERKKEKMKRKEEEQKRREHKEMYADSFERVNEWMKLKRRQEYLQRKKQKEEQIEAEQEKEVVMVFGGRLKYEPVPTEKQANGLEKQQDSEYKTDQKQEDVLRAEPLLKQREKQRRLLLNTGPKQAINLNKTLNLSHLSKENERKESLNKHTANQMHQDTNAVEEITLQHAATITNLHPADKRSSLVKTPIRRVNEPVALPRQSLSPSKVNIPTGNVRVSPESENIKKKITFDDWLSRKKAEDERKRLAEHRTKEQEKNTEDLGRSVEIKKINLSPEKKRVPTGSAESLNKRGAPRLKSALRRPQVQLEQESAVRNEQQDSSENEPHEEADGVIEDLCDVTETPENSPRPSKKVTTSNEKAASEVVTDNIPNPYVIGGSNVPATVLHAKSPKPKVAVRPTLRSVKYQRGSWERFSDYLWDQVNEVEGGELTSGRDKSRQQPMGAEDKKVEASLERGTEKLEDNYGNDKTVEAGADIYEESEYGGSRNFELNGGERIDGDVCKVPYRGSQVNEHLQNLEARGRKRRELDELLSKSEKSKMPLQIKEVDDDFDESYMRNCTDAMATGGSIGANEKLEGQLQGKRESNSIPTLPTDSGFEMSGARSYDIRTIIDSEDEETETEMEAETKPGPKKMNTKAETRTISQMNSRSVEHKQIRGTTHDKEHDIKLPPHASSGDHVHLSDSEEEIVSDLEFVESNSSKAD